MWQPGMTLEDMERSTILKALQYCEGNQTNAAKMLGIALRTLAGKVAEYRKGKVVIPYDQPCPPEEEAPPEAPGSQPGFLAGIKEATRSKGRQKAAG